MSEPRITLRAAHDGGPGNTPPSRVVIHATCPGVGYPAASGPRAASGTASYFALPAAGGSAHYVCDPADEQHCVPDDTIAYHAPPNAHSIGIEICAEGGNYATSYTRAQWLSDDVWPAVLRAAQRTRELCTRYQLPLAQLSAAAVRAGDRGVCGHADVSVAYGMSTHTDPGPWFPWPEFMAAVRSATPTGADVNLSDRLPNLYTSATADTLTVGDTMAWGTAHAANARDRATEARDASRALASDVDDLRDQLRGVQGQLAAILVALAPPGP